MVYLARKNGVVVHHTSLAELKKIDGIDTPEIEVPDADFETAGCLARIISGKIVIGKTPEEVQAETNAQRKVEIEAELLAIDTKSGRAARAVSIAIAGGKTPAKSDTDRLDQLEAEAKTLRAELKTL
ncbi:MAG: hypothetical protein LBD20_02330 [Spirochaetaceae bacterium]|jgi:hypothetical protein|nr:hypothetical protein [Spirochaetaceae bacterium]